MTVRLDGLGALSRHVLFRLSKHDDEAQTVYTTKPSSATIFGASLFFAHATTDPNVENENDEILFARKNLPNILSAKQIRYKTRLQTGFVTNCVGKFI